MKKLLMILAAILCVCGAFAQHFMIESAAVTKDDTNAGHYGVPMHGAFLLKKNPKVTLDQIYMNLGYSGYVDGMAATLIEINFSIDNSTPAGKKLNSSFSEVSGIGSPQLKANFYLDYGEDGKIIEPDYAYLSKPIKEGSNWRYTLEVATSVEDYGRLDLSNLMIYPMTGFKLTESRYQGDLNATLMFDHPIDELGYTLAWIAIKNTASGNNRKNRHLYPGWVSSVERRVSKYVSPAAMPTMAELAQRRLPTYPAKTESGAANLSVYDLATKPFGILAGYGDISQIDAALQKLSIRHNTEDKKITVFKNDNYDYACQNASISLASYMQTERHYRKYHMMTYSFGYLYGDKAVNTAKEMVENFALSLQRKGVDMRPYDLSWDSEFANHKPSRGGYRGYIGNSEVVIQYEGNPANSNAYVHIDIQTPVKK